MAGSSEKGRPTNKKLEMEIIDQAKKRLKLAVDSDDHNRSAAIDDLKFANNDQWDSREKKRRTDKGRPALTLNFLPKFINQVVGDMLHNSPSIKVKPIDSMADVQIAKIRQGIINSIEYQSNAKGIYGYGSRQMVTCGYGGWRILTRYTEENPFIQEIYIEGIRNPFVIYLDPSSKDQNYADAKWGLLLEKMSKSEFEDRYPKAVLPTDGLNSGKGLSDEMWYDGDNVTVAEYFTKESETVTMLQLSDGKVVTEEEFKILVKEWEEKQSKLISTLDNTLQQSMSNSRPQVAPPSPVGMSGAGLPPLASAPFSPQAAPQMGQPTPQSPPQPNPQEQIPGMVAKDLTVLGEEPRVVKRRDTEKTVIKHRILTCMEILVGGHEGKNFPGKYIPLVLLKGSELNIEGKNYVFSLIRHAKDPQKLINYWNTAAAETIALAPKAPWLGTAKQFEGYENDYAAANVENFPFLKYNPDPEAPGAPQRQNPGQPPVAIFEQIRRGEENLKSVIGMFNADVGASGSEQTGAAITARQRPGDIGTSEYSENLARAVTHTGRIINEMIPEIYDTERDVRIRNFDESETFVPINTTVGNAVKHIQNNPERYMGLDSKKLQSIFSKEGKEAKFNDITVGKYDIVVTTGPSYSTQRQESAMHLLQLVQSMPQQMGLAADLIVQNLDFKDSDELATRIRKTLPPNLIKPRQGEAPPTPLPPSPQVQLAQSKLQLQQLKIQQENVKLEHEKIKMQLELAKMQKEMNSPDEQGNQPDQSEIAEKMVNLQLQAQRLQLEREKFEHQRGNDLGKLAHERQKSDDNFTLGMMKVGQGEQL